jgi:HD-like signal output (HDOD) protein
MALMAAFRTEHELGVQFHRSSVLSGSLAGLLARDVGGIDCGVAFLAGLLSEVGAMACIAVDGSAYASILEVAAGDWKRRATLEREHYTLTSWEIGGRLLDRNDLPASITRAVGSHYDMPASELSAVDRVMLFGRVMAPEILAHPPEDELELLDERLEQVAELCYLERVGGKRLIEICHRALAAADRTMTPG